MSERNTDVTAPPEFSRHLPPTNASIAEHDLLLRARSGDTAAFHGLYRMYSGRVYAVCLRIAADTHNAEELTQEAFITAWEMLSTFRGDSAFGTWLHRIAVNKALESLRAIKRRGSRVEMIEDLDAAAAVNRQSVTPDHGTAMDLEAAIAKLPAGARAIFVLHDMEGYRHEEIAESLGLAVGTSKAQLHRARTMLKESLR